VVQQKHDPARRLVLAVALKVSFLPPLPADQEDRRLRELEHDIERLQTIDTNRLSPDVLVANEGKVLGMHSPTYTSKLTASKAVN
jgi:hypothetical protein